MVTHFLFTLSLVRNNAMINLLIFPQSYVLETTTLSLTSSSEKVNENYNKNVSYTQASVPKGKPQEFNHPRSFERDLRH